VAARRRSEGFVSLVLVSHSTSVACGIAELAAQVAGPDVRILPVGGGEALGVDGARELTALRRTAQHGDGVVLMDLGSSVLAVRAALAELGPDERLRICPVDAPFVEGAIAAAVMAATGASRAAVASAAEDARHVSKL
jgi:PTS hybrid protein